MGNLRRYMPISHILMLIGSLALAGIPPFAGFFSKDLILESAYASHNSVGLFAYIVGVCVALMTALYSFKIFLMAFWGKKNNNQVNIKEGSNYMIIPMVVLAIGAVLLGYLTKDIFGGDQTRITYWSNIIAGNLNDVIHHAHHVPLYIKLLPLIAGILGIIIAIILYADYSYDEIKDTNRTSNPLYKFVANRWYIDHLYNTIIVKPFIIIARIASDIVDKFIIDGLTTRLPVYNARINAKILVYIQNGQVNNYIIATLFGFAMILLITLF
jgi:NADH-quinone oxidoreductase subunit L